MTKSVLGLPQVNECANIGDSDRRVAGSEFERMRELLGPFRDRASAAKQHSQQVTKAGIVTDCKSSASFFLGPQQLAVAIELEC
jgi:hypothetical protein